MVLPAPDTAPTEPPTAPATVVSAAPLTAALRPEPVELAAHAQPAAGAARLAPLEPSGAAPVAAAVDAPAVELSHPDWDQALGRRLIGLVQGQVQRAEIKINPPHLGPLEVRLSLQHDQASVTFITGGEELRAMIETSLPRLREMLGEHGFRLGHSDVFSRHHPGRRRPGYPGRGAAAAPEADPGPVVALGRTAVGLVDHYI